MNTIPIKKCKLQEFYTRIPGLAIVHEIPKCKSSGWNCGWYGEETKCNRYVKPYKEGGAK